MSSRWFFREFKPGDNLSDPDFTRTLFARDTDAAYALALVRESIQNSLDARGSRDAPVRVRFVVRTGRAAAPASAVARFFEGAWEHLHADMTGVEEPPAPTDPVPFLVVEDFGTRGLTGDPAKWDPFEAEANPFFLFFRALGRSGKAGEARGRWGVGKFVFPLVSRGHCLFGYTVPADSGQRLLMGRMILKTHKSGTVSYHPDGHWGLRAPEGGLVVPESDSAAIESFRRAFSIRRTDEPGLSVMVPWLRAEIDGATISEAVIGEYFLPLLRDELTVEIDHNGTTTVVDSRNVEAIAEELGSTLLRARIQLALHAATWPSNEIEVLTPPNPDRDLDWDEEHVSEEQRARLLAKLEAGKAVAVRIPVTVRPKNAPAAGSHFDIFLQDVESVGSNRPLIVREGITIPQDATRPLHDRVALIVVDDAPLATLVGDAETPAHTDLQHKLVAPKYTFAKKVIELIRFAPLALVRRLEQGSREEDFSLLADLFPLQDAEAAPRGKTKKPARAGETDKPDIDAERRPPGYSVLRSDRGFTVKGSGRPDRLPAVLTVRFAYDVRRGNPLRRYRPMDFSLQRGDLAVDVTAAEVVEQGDNMIVLRPSAPDFVLAVTGFDSNRDVIVRVDASGAAA